MARKKSTETEVVEEVQEVTVAQTPEVVADPVVEDTVAEEVAAEDKPKRGRKKKTEEPEVVETPEVVDTVVDEPATEPEVVVEETPVVEPIPEEKPAKAKKSDIVEVKETPKSTSDKVIATANLYVLKTPGVLTSKIGNYKVGTKFTVLEEKNGWGKVAEDKWINLNYVEKI